MAGGIDNTTAFSANRARASAPRRVVLVAFDGVEPIDLAGPSSVFGRAALIAPGSYTVIHAASGARAVQSAIGLEFSGLTPLENLKGPIDTILVAGGDERALRLAAADADLMRWLRRRSRTARRIGSVCTGAFVLAAAGLLNGRRAVTHWGSCDLLAKLSPQTRVEPDALYVIDGKVCSSAGVTAGIDLALALVEQDLGAEVASRIAREMVLFLRRPGGQSQYSASLSAQAAAPGPLASLIAWMSDHPAADLSVPALAARARMSERTFLRAFRAGAGQTPAAFVRDLRVECARRWLETTTWPVKRVAQRAGFGSEDSLARAFRARLGVTPSDVRARFGRV